MTDEEMLVIAHIEKMRTIISTNRLRGDHRYQVNKLILKKCAENLEDEVLRLKRVYGIIDI